jgi:predicted ATPase
VTTAGPSDRFVVISGCSGAGKSTLVAELGRRGYTTVDEPGRRIVREELERGGSALPWTNIKAFLQGALDMALQDFTRASGLSGLVFFDRGLIDAAAGLERMTGKPASSFLDPPRRYHRRVFLAPPWQEIHVTDQERRHDLKEAIAEYEHLLKLFPTLGYQVMLLPKVGVSERADFVLRALQRADDCDQCEHPPPRSCQDQGARRLHGKRKLP